MEEENNPQEAHDIVNKEINVILKGCGDDFSNPSSAYRMCCKGDLCYDCKGKLKGIISMEASEIEFLDKLLENNHKFMLESLKDCPTRRLQALKISIADLKEKVE